MNAGWVCENLCKTFFGFTHLVVGQSDVDAVDQYHNAVYIFRHAGERDTAACEADALRFLCGNVPFRFV